MVRAVRLRHRSLMWEIELLRILLAAVGVPPPPGGSKTSLHVFGPTGMHIITPWKYRMPLGCCFRAFDRETWLSGAVDLTEGSRY